MFVFDLHTSTLEGSISAIPRRVMVDDRNVVRARTLVEAARAEIGLAADIRWRSDDGPDTGVDA